jgi:hypothetical protein
MIALKQINNIYDIYKEKERLLAKNLKSIIYVKPTDITCIREVFNINTKKVYKKRSLINVREVGEVIVLNSPQELLIMLNTNPKIGYGRK